MMAPGAPALALASGSAARRALMAAAGLRFTVRPAGVDEDAIKARGGDPAEVAMALADAKAAAMPGGLVIGADQMLVCEGECFDKPPTPAAARAQLGRLRGRWHELLTAVACWRDGARAWSYLARPSLRMRAFSPAFLDAYLAAEGDAALGSVGAYRFEGLGVHLFDAVEGEHAAILGLPMTALLGYLREAGVVLR